MIQVVEFGMLAQFAFLGHFFNFFFQFHHFTLYLLGIESRYFFIGLSRSHDSSSIFDMLTQLGFFFLIMLFQTRLVEI